MKPMGPHLDPQAEQESELLDSLQMVGFPKDEEARRQAWMSLPRETRAAIRRLHHISGHKPKQSRISGAMIALKSIQRQQH